MILTFREILRRAGAKLNNPGTGTTNADDLYPKLKDWANEVYERVYNSYPWTGALEDTTLTITASTASYALERDIGKIWTVYDQTNGKLVTVTVDTTGYFIGDGPWDLRMTDTVDVPTELLGPVEDPPGSGNWVTEAIPLQITNGSISIIPEPATLVMLLTLLAALSLVHLWRKRSK